MNSNSPEVRALVQAMSEKLLQVRIRTWLESNSFTLCRLLFNLGDIYFNIPSSSESDSLVLSYMK